MNSNKLIKNILTSFLCFGKKSLTKIGLIMFLILFLIIYIWLINEVSSLPLDSIKYNFMTVLSDLMDIRWTKNETISGGTTTSDTILATSVGEKCWVAATTYKGMFTVPNFTWDGSGHVLVNGTWNISVKYRETSGGGGFSSATCRFRTYISKINASGNYQIYMMDNVGGTDVCGGSSVDVVTFNVSNIPYSDVTNLTSSNDRLNVTICAFVTASGKKSYLAHYMNSSADSFVIMPNQTFDTGSPQWSNNATNFTSPIFFTQNAGYRFNVTWTDNFALSKVLIEHNFSGNPVPQNYTVTNNQGDVYYYEYSNIQPGTYIWREFANDTSNNWNITDYWTIIAYNATLEVNLIAPDPSKTTYVTQNQTFPINATVYCRTYPDGNSCGEVNSTAMYNSSSKNPDIPINKTEGEPFYVNEIPSFVMKSCPTNPLDANEFCNLTWIINATGNMDKGWEIGILFNSSLAEVQKNHTDNATVYITSCTEEIELTWGSINFGLLTPSTNYNNATYNNQNFYNITNKGTCTLNLWIKGTDLQNFTYNSKIEVANLSWSNMTNDYTVFHTNMTYNYALLNSSLPPNRNLTTYYWLSVPAIYYGPYDGSVFVCGNYSTTC